MGQGQGHTSDNLVHGHSRAGAAQQGRIPGGTGGTAADREAGWGRETDAAVRTAWEAGRQGAAEEKGAYDREAATTPASPVATGWQGNPCSGPCRALPASSYAPPPLPRTACWALPAAESVPCVGPPQTPAPSLTSAHLHVDPVSLRHGPTVPHFPVTVGAPLFKLQYFPPWLRLCALGQQEMVIEASAHRHKKILVSGAIGDFRPCSVKQLDQWRTYREHSVEMTPCLLS